MRMLALMLPGALLLAAALAAQENSATLRGILTDTSGAVIPGATVSLTGGKTVRSAVTQTDGSYALVGLTPGEYTVKVQFPGFDAFEKVVSAGSGESVPFPIQLTPSGGNQQVTVSDGAGPELSTDPADNHSALVLTGDDLDALPDDPDDLADMLTQLAGPASGAMGGAQILLDGFSNAQLPPKAAIKEIRVNQNPFAAQYDYLGFGRIEIITKPGADNFRGGVGLTDSDAFFNSRNPYAENKADYVNRMFTANLGGPMSHRASFLVNFYHSTINNTALINAVTLNPATLAEVPVQSSVLTPRADISGNARLDYQITPNQTFTGSYQYYLSNRDNNGIGAYSLVSRAYNNEQTRHDVRLTETAVVNASIVTETKFSFTQISTQQFGDNSVPGLIVAGSFNAGSAQIGRASNLGRQYEFQSNTTEVHGGHSLKFGARLRYSSTLDVSPANFGGTFSFFGVGNAPVLNSNNQVALGPNSQPLTAPITSLEQYRRTLLFEGLGYSPAAVQAMGGGASQFSIAAGNPMAQVGSTDAGLYVLDDWQVRPNLTVSLGMRYELQSTLSDHRDLGPRLAVAWSPGGKSGSPPKTVIRVGAGMFYQRFSTNYILQADRFNGGSLSNSQQQFVVTNPDFFPNVPSLPEVLAAQQPPTTYRLQANLRTLAVRDSALTIERQLPGKTTISGTILNVLATHMMSIVNVNTPLPGTYIPDEPMSGVRPLGNAAGNVFVYEGDGFLRQNLGWVQVTNKVNPRVSMTAYYSLLFAKGDADYGSYPTNPYNIMQDYGRSSSDRHQYFEMAGTLKGPLGLQFSPFLVVASGIPYDLQIGSDLNGDTIANERPAFATDLSRASVVMTRFGAFDTNPMPGQPLVPRNYLTGSGLWNLNARLGRTFGFGKARTGQGSAEHRYTLNVNVDVNNVFNHVNQGGYVGNLSSPLFGQSTNLYLFRDTSNNRRVQFGMQFNF
jgi:Carboxypeptidase regulatory-like domain